MRHLSLAPVLVAGALAVAPSPASAAMKSCGAISGWKVAADAETTSCALAKSATRSFLRRLGAGNGTPERIVGRRDGQRFRLRLARTDSKQTVSKNVYRGRDGDAVLRVRISSRLN